jgi:ATP-dependent RNA helicase DDX56/DBP9
LYARPLTLSTLQSATLSPELDKFKKVLLHSPVVLKLDEGSDGGVSSLLQFYLQSCDKDKFLILYVFLKLGLLQGKGLIFANDVNKCYKLKLFLKQFGISAAVLNSEIPLNSRIHALEEYNRGVFDLLIATDASIDAGQEDEREDEEEEEAAGEGDDDDMEGGLLVGDGTDGGDLDEEDEEDDDDDDDDDENDDDDDESVGDVEQAGLLINDGVDGGDLQESEGEGDKEQEEKKDEASRRTKNQTAAEGYGVSRGIDFHGVGFVVNFDMPLTSAAYTHRIGRTARGGASGTALSFITGGPGVGSMSRADEIASAKRDSAILAEVQHQQPRLGVVEGDNVLAAMGGGQGISEGGADDESRMQPAPLVFNMQELETFRYRVEDILRSVTVNSVQEMRMNELRQEILNSKKLKEYFENSKDDLKVLRHDKANAHPLKAQQHLQHVPQYLIPVGMRSVADVGARNRRKRKGGSMSSDARVRQSKMNDPLAAAAVGGGDGEGDEAAGDGVVKGEVGRALSDRELRNSNAGRTAWKIRHKKGKFSKKGAGAKKNGIAGAFTKSKKHGHAGK